ncbi:response regulator [Vibrio lentus]|uniref:response regulator n=1 Tax=Vibrio lentus TaxID=136468 RepID=UPI000C816828|nr:response regulator [Vibrio lentus]PMI84904.1 hypothetical protein BCU36_05135 [Vibrio lentus]
MKVLIVDDNKPRCSEIIDLISRSTHISKDDIFFSHSGDNAKSKLRSMHFDLLILDVVLPRRNESPSPQVGLDLLKQIKKRPTLKKPDKIIGITAQVDDISAFRTSFDEHCEVIIEASHRNSDWKAKILNCIEFEGKKKLSRYASDKTVTCITVHGIRTRGCWQETLKKAVISKLDSVNFESYKFGYFTVVSFLIPFLRNIQISRFKKSLINLNYANNKIIIFSHSFGTYIVINAIEQLLMEGHKIDLDKLILSGSVLRSSHDFSSILAKTDVKIINDCGCDDAVLLLSEGFVPNTGMAGKVGFYGLNNDRFVNRYFRGGHSHYFDVKGQFITNYWLPLFSEVDTLDVIDERSNGIVSLGIVDKFFSILGQCKEFIYLALIIYTVYLIYLNL